MRRRLTAVLARGGEKERETNRQRETETENGERQRRKETEGDRDGKRQGDRDGQRQTDTKRDRQREESGRRDNSYYHGPILLSLFPIVKLHSWDENLANLMTTFGCMCTACNSIFR